MPARILIVGAGPSGLSLALQAQAHGAQVRIVDRRAEAPRPSRAMILHPRTLEVLRPLGVTHDLLALASTDINAKFHVWPRSVRIELGELALRDTAFPHLSLIRQTDVEKVLAEALYRAGTQVDRGTELVGLDVRASSVRARLTSRAGLELSDWDFVAGCDGQESTVRRAAGVGWPGHPYREEVILADVDVETALDPGTAHVAPTKRGLLFMFPLGEHATWRVLATRLGVGDGLRFGQPGPPIVLDALQALFDDSRIPVRITSLAWSARYALQQRLATYFRSGRVFLVGDAAHAHSPALGLGMNTGIQDAVNLGWKLAFAHAATEPERLLESYELERRPAAQRVLALTQLAFWGEASSSLLPSAIRSTLVPAGAPVLPRLLALRGVVARVFRTISQLDLSYHASPVNLDSIPARRHGPRAGARLPDRDVVRDARRTRLHSLLARPGVHVLVDRDTDSIEVDAEGLIRVHRLSDSPGRGLVAVRPDGYVGFQTECFHQGRFQAWLAAIGAKESHLP